MAEKAADQSVKQDSAEQKRTGRQNISQPVLEPDEEQEEITFSPGKRLARYPAQW